MAADRVPDVDLAGLAVARLRSERLRVLCMMTLFAVIAAIGFSRIVFLAADDHPAMGWIVMGVSLLFLAGEVYALAAVRRAIDAQRTLDTRLVTAHALLECVYPIAVLFVLMAVNPDGRYTLLVSPGYAFLMILIAISVLRVDAGVTAGTGALATVGYAALVATALGGASDVENPHPTTLYVNNALMLALATGASAFVAREFRGYLLAAVREMDVRRQRDRLQRDLKVAGEIQEHLLPRTSPNLPGYDIAAVCRSADETGGDYYDWQEIGPRRAVFTLGDVTGHGVGPALVTAACRAFVRAIVANDPQPSSVLHRANRLLHDDLPEGRFVTLVLVDIDAESHEAHLLSAGHGPTLHVSGRDGSIEEIMAQGMPLALVDEQEMDAAVRCALAPGDLLVLCSDGFFEAINPDGELFGMERLKELIVAHRALPAAELLAKLEVAVREFLATAPQPDDMTALVIKRAEA